ncbi:MAG: hypothetical protein LPK19_05955 [Hymenobacteraceae bacterium]|nr:hypothetical protein [Hymenobacteraceae bacterium]MDX5395744.1 hypothetical protein [Hymenobacteraceae bacterium]MDX5511798.1 hypothetical protein [Hymenobacteraceae bacterium]
MKNKLIPLLLLFAAFFISENLLASHAQGSDLTYVNIGPNMYVVNFSFYRDCSGIAASTSEVLNYTAPGCSNGGTLTLPKQTATMGNLYCPGTQPICVSGNTITNYEEHVYSGTVTLPTACSEWLFSVRIGVRNESRNILNSSSEYLYSEAMLNSVAAPDNNSPTFGNIPVPAVGVNLPFKYSHNVIETDGDSLVYSLQPALNDRGISLTYSPGFSATAPLGPNANPGVWLDPVSGAVSFTPTHMDYNTLSALGLNKYVIVVQVDEYRKNLQTNTWAKIGHVRRDVLVTVIDCGPNLLPALEPMVFNGDTVTYNSVLEVEAGQPLTFQVKTTDMNPQDRMEVTSNVFSYFPGAIVSFMGSIRPTVTYNFTPSASQVRDYPYYFTITVKDDACPIRGFNTETVGLRVKAAGTTTAVKEDLAKKYNLQTLLTPNNYSYNRLVLAPELRGAAVSIYSPEGRLIKSYSRYDNSWSGNEVAAGVYIYQVEHQQLKQVMSSRLMVVK